MKKFVLFVLCIFNFNIYSQEKIKSKITGWDYFTIAEYYKDNNENKDFNHEYLYCEFGIEKEYISNTCHITDIELGIIKLPSMEAVNTNEKGYAEIKGEYLKVKLFSDTDDTCEDIETELNNYLNFLVFTKEKIFTDSTISNEQLEYKRDGTSVDTVIYVKEKTIHLYDGIINESDIDRFIKFIPNVQEKINKLKKTFN